MNAPSKIYWRICSSPLNLSTRANLQSVTKFVPSLITALLTHDLWPDHYRLCQLVEDDYATCRRTTTLLFGFSAGKVINAMSKWTFSKSLASLLFRFMLPRVFKASSQDACELIGACEQDLGVWTGRWWISWEQCCPRNAILMRSLLPSWYCRMDGWVRLMAEPLLWDSELLLTGRIYVGATASTLVVEKYQI